MRFYQRCTIDDPDAPGASFAFDLADAAHAACFNVGTGADGGTLISWSPLHCLYALPDGACWAEHAMLWDAEDLVRVWPSPCCSGTRQASAGSCMRDYATWRHAHLLTPAALPGRAAGWGALC